MLHIDPPFRHPPPILFFPLFFLFFSVTLSTTQLEATVVFSKSFLILLLRLRGSSIKGWDPLFSHVTLFPAPFQK